MLNDEVSARDYWETRVTVHRPIDGGVDILRAFSCEIELATDDERAGAFISGWIGWNVSDEDIADAADAISTDASGLGAIAAEIRDSHPDHWVDSVLLIDRMFLHESKRGKRLTRLLIEEVVAFFRLDPYSTAITLQPEPQAKSGGPLPDGAERDAALASLQSAYTSSGLSPWNGSPIWWRPFPPYDLEGLR
ncbi:hypothetical protein CH274_05395 [Rhodococcus sp. 06-418-5]|uniref:hypothetical protein n=1 Tax=Rhodococcus sp. 06-418-5 TaxID=2022507 RepID=UPI000B9C099A|nr:hypothetical protein [Rhodococcus sp. 06-418-5]OZC85021.1 hypothetical protein CH274_04195 [Rhodococcus sp. 06-418-5]OZC85217.1 hypothetical protein CH274_05395 [Rhodococcus sp. 06-418-5]